MRIEPHAPDPSDGQDADIETTRRHPPDDSDQLVDREAVFVPPARERQERAPSYLHHLLKEGYCGFSASEVEVLRSVEFIRNSEGTEVVSPRSLGQIFAKCKTVIQIGVQVSRQVARRMKAPSGVPQAADGEDLLQEAILRYLDGSWNYPRAKFETDLAAVEPARWVARSLFGQRNRGRILSVQDGKKKQRTTRIESEHVFNSATEDESDVGLVRNGVTMLDNSRLSVHQLLDLMLPEVRGLLHELIEAVAAKRGWGKHSAAATTVFQELCDFARQHGDTTVPYEAIAAECGVTESFARDMAKTGYDRKTDKYEYVLEKIMKHARDSQAYDKLQSLCPHALRQQYQYLGIAAAARALGFGLEKIGMHDTQSTDSDDTAY